MRACARCGRALGVFGARGTGACCVAFSALAWTTPAPYFLQPVHKARVTPHLAARGNLRLEAGCSMVWGKEAAV